MSVKMTKATAMPGGSAGEGCDPATESCAIAPRLVWVRNQLGKILANLEIVSEAVVASAPRPADMPSSNCDSDLAGVLADCESLTNSLGEMANRLSGNLGNVGMANHE